MYRQKETDDQHCLECGDKLPYGRSDRKFCCGTCKNRYHNRIMRQSRNYKQKVKDILERNYMILDSLRRTTLKNIPLSDLERMGFRLDFFTSCGLSSKRESYMCYDIRYHVTDGVVTSIARISIGSEDGV